MGTPPQRNAFDVLLRRSSSDGTPKRKAGTAAAEESAAKRMAVEQQQQHQRDQRDQPHDDHGHEQQRSKAGEERLKEQQEARVAFMRALSGPPRPAKQQFSHLLVIDLEATCNKARTLSPVEIIEFSCVVLDTVTAQPVGEYQSYVRPTEHPCLDAFCVSLTGITQAQVDAAPPLATALSSFDTWLKGTGIPLHSCLAATWTTWDLEVAMAMECKWRGLRVEPYLLAWVDLKAAYNRHHKRNGNLRACVQAAGLEWEGRAHSGLDDARNEARLAAHLMTRGVRFEITGSYGADAPHAPAVQPQQQQGATHHAGLGGNSSGAAAAASGGDAPRQRQSLLAPLRSAASGAVTVYDQAGKWLGICKCGVKAAARVTKKPGANHGRSFWSCGRWRLVAREGRKPCDFFQWAGADD